MSSLKKYKCLLADDEPIARQIVKNYIEQSPQLELVSECKNGFEAFETIAKQVDIELIFLDINMPNLSGISMAKSLVKRPQIIFTTAYHEFAVESYELDAADYLLKPFSFERFTKAINKAIERIENAKKAALVSEDKSATLLLKSDGKIYPVKPSDILYCEAMKNYTKVFLANGERLIPLIALSKMEQELKATPLDFIKVHRSFIVNKNCIRAIEGAKVIVENHKVPIGDQFREDLMKAFKK
jgi:two-component system, LytTR family, response regulator